MAEQESLTMWYSEPPQLLFAHRELMKAIREQQSEEVIEGLVAYLAGVAAGAAIAALQAQRPLPPPPPSRTVDKGL